MANHVLWADDDAGGALVPLQWLLESRSVPAIVRVRDYFAAKEALSNHHSDDTPFSAALLDIILPYARQRPSLNTYMGLILAQHALSTGVSTIVFLTVVPKIEIVDQLRELQQANPKATFGYFSKFNLLEPAPINEMAQLLGGNNKK
jgi:hypothetical protein